MSINDDIEHMNIFLSVLHKGQPIYGCINAGDVIYNAYNPLIAPDVIFGPEDESFHPYRGTGEESLSKSKKNSLSGWNYKDPTCLLFLILELR